MKTLYQASNLVEAHMIVDLLRQEGLSGRVDGEYLQGGIGELPAAGLIRVVVEEQDYTAAKAIVERWDAAQPLHEPAPPPQKTGSRLTTFVFGLIAGLALSFAYYQAPVTTEGTDHNSDGVLDDRWTYARSNRALKNEVDRNLDGKIDYIANFNRFGIIHSSQSDDNFDGVFESRITYRQGNAELGEMDTNGDGYRDLRTNFEHGVHVATEYIYPATGRPQKIEYVRLGKITYAELDTNRDGTMDKLIKYDEIGEVLTVEDIRQ
jgi:hypothetical protein